MVRLLLLDNDTRPQPKTDRYCVKCQQDLKPTSPARMIHLIYDGAPMIVHPEDEAAYELPEGAEDYGWQLLGMDCVRSVGIDWTHETPATPTSKSATASDAEDE